MSEGTRVPDVEAALAAVGLAPDRTVSTLSDAEMAAFRCLIGWTPGGPVVAYPTADEIAARDSRERWKAERAGLAGRAPRIWLDDDQLACFGRNLADDADTADWWSNVIARAEEAAALPLDRIAALVPEQGPWPFAGSFCPNCVGERSPVTQHAGLWTWRVDDPDRLLCPYCDIAYPHPDFPEEGTLDLPRLSLAYSFHVSARERAADDWRDGENASSFGAMPTHVSFVGEIRTVKLAWCLGQLEPLAFAHAVTSDARYADVVRTILSRLADVYPAYPVFSYAQEFVDADPAYAVANVDAIPTPFRRAATIGTYTGAYRGLTGHRGMDCTTTSVSYYQNAEWGTSRLGREKASNGQLFLSCFRAYDLVKGTILDDERVRIERDFLLELYLDTVGLSRRVNNKSGPGAAARVAVGAAYGDEEAVDEGLAQFHAILESQFYPDGSWKETPIYGAKSINEGMWEIPEILRGRIDLYADPLYRQAFETYAELATPLDTQPAIGDSTADFRLQPVLVDLARIRMRLPLSYGPSSLAGFGVRSPGDISTNSGYTPSMNAVVTEDTRVGLDGGAGFGVVSHIPRPTATPSWIARFNAPARDVGPPGRPAANRRFDDRGLVCLGFGPGEGAVQLYCDVGDGRATHRHHAPLTLLLFAAGREVFPDQGYIGDHPANAWIKSTHAHNTVVVDGRSALPPVRTDIRAFVSDRPFCFVDATAVVPRDDGPEVRMRRAVVVVPKPDGLPILVDVFDVTGGRTHDYVVRVNDPSQRFDASHLSFTDTDPPWPALPDPGPHGFRSAGPTRDAFTATWGDAAGLPVRAHVLTPADDVMTFRSPAWRDRVEAFEAPDRSWDALVLRASADTTRHVVVYDIGGARRWIAGTSLDASGDTVRVRLTTEAGPLTVTVADAACSIDDG